jgi:hypothetical protein
MTLKIEHWAQLNDPAPCLLSPEEMEKRRAFIGELRIEYKDDPDALADLDHFNGTGMSGEAVEIFNAIKKARFDDHDEKKVLALEKALANLVSKDAEIRGRKSKIE